MVFSLLIKKIKKINNCIYGSEFVSIKKFYFKIIVNIVKVL